MNKRLHFHNLLIWSKKTVLLLAFLLSISVVSTRATGWQGTDKRISGKILDESGQALPGVNILVKGTTEGTTSDADGKYVLTVPDGQVTLVFSFIGYTTQEVPADSRSVIDISLINDVQALQEVVVVGYGEQKKETLTGAVTTADNKLFQNRGMIDNPMSALQGQIAGAVITRSSAAPGRNSWNIQIRGATSVNGSQPLIVIDGIPVSSDGVSSTDGTLGSSSTNSGGNLGGTNALNSINPNDIESMTVLKDASAAIYGARAAGGVILITTKRAKSGKPVIQYDGSVSIKKIGLQPHLLNVRQFGTYLSEAVTNDFVGASPANSLWYKFGQQMMNPPASGYYDFTDNTGNTNPVPSTSNNPNNPGFGDVKDLTFFDTNWVDALWGSATTSQHNLSISNRGDKSGYRVSLGYMDDQSLLKWGNNSNKRYNARLSHDYTFSDKLKLETNVSLEKSVVVMPTMIGAVMGQYQQPGIPLASLNGKAYSWGTQYMPNSQAKYGGDNKESITRLYTNAKITYSILKDLKFVGIAGMNNTFSNVDTQQNSIQWYNYTGTIQAADNPTQAASYYQKQNTTNVYSNLNGYFTYNSTIGNDHNIGATLGGQYETEKNDYFSARTSYIASNEVGSLNLGIGDATTKGVTEAKSQWAIGSYFSRLNYNYKSKYLVEGNLRYDGSSRFDAAHRWKFFYGASAGWILSQEEFIQSIPFISNLKVRASIGSTGNQNGIGLYDYIQLTSISSNTTGATDGTYPIIGAGTVVTAGPTASLVSLNRTWEKVQTQNIGIDFGFLENRLAGSFDYFVKDNTNMLLNQTLPAVLGATAPQANLGHLRTNGWELAIGWRDQIGQVTYRVGGNITDNKNKLVSYSANSIKTSGYNNTVEGYPIGSYFGLQYAGRAQTAEDAATMNALYPNSTVGAPARTVNGAGTVITPGIRPGDNMFVDQNGDGKLTTPEDLVYLGRNDPRYSFGFNMGLEWKGFDFGAIFQGVGKRTIYREGAWARPFGAIFVSQADFWAGKTWSPTNTDAFYPNLASGQNGINYNNYNYQPSTWSVQNGAYLRLKNITLGYTLPNGLTQKIKIEKLRVYVSGNDIWEITKIRDGWDPETSRTVGNSGGVGLERYPFYRLVTFGVNVTL